MQKKTRHAEADWEDQEGGPGGRTRREDQKRGPGKWGRGSEEESGLEDKIKQPHPDGWGIIIMIIIIMMHNTP